MNQPRSSCSKSCSMFHALSGSVGRALAPWLAIVILFAVFPSTACCSTPAEYVGSLVSVDVSSIDAKSVITQLAASAGVNVVVDDSLNIRVTARLVDVEFDQALAIIAAACGASVKMEGDVYLVMNARGYVAPQAPAEQMSVQLIDLSNAQFDSTLALIESMAAGLEVEAFPESKAVVVRGPYSKVNSVKVSVDAYLRAMSADPSDSEFRLVRLAYADAANVAMSLQGQFRNVRIGSVRGDNCISLSGPSEQVEWAMQAIVEFDRIPALLSFDVEIVEVNSDDITSIGFDWANQHGQPMLTLTLKELEFPSEPGKPPTSNVLETRPWVRSSVQISTQIRMLEREGKARVLARPSITTLENKTARIMTGDRYTIVIQQVSGGSTWQQLQYIDSGVLLELTPRLDPEGNIIVNLAPRVSVVTGFSREGYPVMSTRDVQTTVRLRDGETLVIGGLIRDESNEARSDLPGLSTIPLIGPLFASRNKQARRTEVIIVLTPQIVSLR